MKHLKAKALSETLTDRLTDVEIEALGKSAAQRYEGALINNLAYLQKRVDVKTVNETVAEVKAQALVETDTLSHMELDARVNTKKNVEA